MPPDVGPSLACRATTSSGRSLCINAVGFERQQQQDPGGTQARVATRFTARRPAPAVHAGWLRLPHGAASFRVPPNVPLPLCRQLQELYVGWHPTDADGPDLRIGYRPANKFLMLTVAWEF